MSVRSPWCAGALLVGRADLVAPRPLGEVEELEVAALGVHRHRLQQRVVGASAFDARGEPERLLELLGHAGAKDALPVVEAVEALVLRVPEGDVLGLGPGAPRAAQVGQQDVLGVVARPAGLALAGHGVELLQRDAGAAADELEVDEAQVAPPGTMVVSTLRPKLAPWPWVE